MAANTVEFIGTVLMSILGGGSVAGLATAYYKDRGRAQELVAKERKLVVDQLHEIIRVERDQASTAREGHHECLELVNQVSAELSVVKAEHALCPAKVRALEAQVADHSQKITRLLSLHPQPGE